MDISKDELRRQLREVDAEQAAADRRFREVLSRIFDPSSKVDSETKAHVLGVPSRRSFLTVGGVSVLGAAVLAACNTGSNKVASTGKPRTTSASSSSSSSGASSSGSTVSDVVLVKTAASLEALAVAVYGNQTAAALVTDQPVKDAAALFSSHHQAHLEALNALLASAGQPAQTTPNQAVNDAVVAPAVANAKTQDDIIALAFNLEDAAAQTYVFATTALSQASYRSQLMTIAGVEARHRAIIGTLLQKKDPGEIITASFYKKDSPLPRGAVLSG